MGENRGGWKEDRQAGDSSPEGREETVNTLERTAAP